MSAFSCKSSKRDNWIQPRPNQDTLLRNRTHGKILPMEEEPGLLARLFGAR